VLKADVRPADEVDLAKVDDRRRTMR